MKGKNDGWCKKVMVLLKKSKDLVVHPENQPGNSQREPEKALVLHESEMLWIIFTLKVKCLPMR